MTTMVHLEARKPLLQMTGPELIQAYVSLLGLGCLELGVYGWQSCEVDLC